MFRPVIARDMWLGWVFAGLGSAASLPPLAVGAVFVLPEWPSWLRAAGFVLGCSVTLAVMALPRASRRGLVWLADRLLGAELPAPVEPPFSRWADRTRTFAWLAAHAAIGWTVTATTLFCLLAAFVFPGVWLGGGDEVVLIGFDLQIPPGWQGGWTLLLGLGFLLVAGGVTAVATLVLRRLAPVLLGPNAAERLAVAEARLTALARRTQIAQELHDSIGHTLTASTIQAAVALELMDRDPEEARRALRSIEETSRAAMDDLDHVLGALRQEPSPRRPRGTLADLESLVERVRQAGAEVVVATSGDLAGVPSTASAEVYRIVREGLTNVLRHGAKRDVRLRVAVADGSLEVSLSNPVSVRGRRGRGGSGLEGLAERVRVLGGELSAGPSDDGARWQLKADIPLPSSA
ncbi:sensor histidine kinase [Actinocorallia sp. A-T 12471]|uniref:sensor histidine kinase n=1 Tax=Actinocorallia sp. A-T 12471 TaxID=3089813 RepID=UPI0029CCE5E9|nr:histidine kinase [Actinocorallia sp. A-T 12471]MDX6741937.1 histidine kinase [Actinocorallia sp. A-T 12471]